MLLFQLWKKEHGRVYNDLEEMSKRFEIFVSNLNYITGSNAQRKSQSSSPSRHHHLLGVSKFADLSPTEFKEMYLHDFEMANDNGMNGNNELLSCKAPSSLDWRQRGVVTAVKNQGTCGSCWTFSAAGAIEGVNAIATGELISLSEQQILDCDPESKGCHEGYVYQAFNWVMSNGGIALDATYPYEGKKLTCQSSQIVHNNATIDGYGHVPQSDKGLFCATAKQPVSVCLNAVDFQFYHSGIYDGQNCAPTDYSNHCVLIVGYDSIEGQDFWIVKNSWGENWGLNGYIWIKRNTDLPYGVCGINASAYIPIKKH
ncbi:hypothetical protein PIB30_057773 [Stylosanthes scabra]|uniref:Uncharacterized protein n=1 Tax=Stylosanthes scabra TaxID=79078 RepID=A0ABU6QJE9_9FABA|nr:hypothetical protein [Stylosanthes scabra]